MTKKKTLTKEYFGVLSDVYAEKGPLAAIGYDVVSTLSDLRRVLNLFDAPKSYRPPESQLPYGKERVHYKNWIRERDKALGEIAKRNFEVERSLLRAKKDELEIEELLVQRLTREPGEFSQEQILYAAEQLGYDVKKVQKLLSSRKDRLRLEGRVAVFLLSIVAGIGLSFSSLSATGNVILSLSKTTQGLSGIFLFIFGLAGLTFGSDKK